MLTTDCSRTGVTCLIWLRCFLISCHWRSMTFLAALVRSLSGLCDRLQQNSDRLIFGDLFRGFMKQLWSTAILIEAPLIFFFFWSLLKGCFLSFSAWVGAVAKRSLITCFVLCPPDYSCDIWFHMFLSCLLNCEWMSTVKSKGCLHCWNFVSLIFVTPPLPQYPIYVFSYSLGWQLTIIFSIDRLTHRLLE